MAKLLKH